MSLILLSAGALCIFGSLVGILRYPWRSPNALLIERAIVISLFLGIALICTAGLLS